MLTTRSTLRSGPATSTDCVVSEPTRLLNHRFLEVHLLIACAGKLAPESGPVHSFQSLLRDLAISALNWIITTLNDAMASC